MKLYSDFAARRSLQIAADAVALLVLGLSVWLAVVLHGLIAGLAEAGTRIESAGSDLESTLRDAGERLGGVPLVGDGVRGAFDDAADAGSTLAEAGRTQQDVVATAAVLVPLLVVVLALLAVSWAWLRRRLLFVRRATAAARLSRLADGDDLLALRALATASARELERIAPAPARAWRAGDPSAVRGLAALELRRSGIRLPTATGVR
jgi:hypothetical protein